MARYIPIRTFKLLYENEADLLNPKQLGVFRSKLEDEGTRIAEEKNISEKDFTVFAQNIEIPENVLYYNWTERNKTIEDLLLEGSLSQFQDVAAVQKHRLFNNYKRFISPFLSNALLSATINTVEDRAKAFSYVCLLDDDHSAVVEQSLFKPIQKELKEAYDSLRYTEHEQLLIDRITPLCSDEIISCVNALSRSMYSVRLGYVDDVLKFIRTKPCTVRFANWLLKRMELVNLNAEHENRITDWKQELKEGKIKVRNDGVKGRTPIRWKPLISVLLLIGVVGIVFYIVKYEPFSELQSTDDNMNTSFKQFTLEERKKIDSLLKEMEGEGHLDDFIDYGAPIIGGSATITLRKEFSSSKMEAIFEDLDKDANLQEKGFVDTCVASVSYEPISGTKNLEERKGELKSAFRNESDYDLILFVSEGKHNGEVFSINIKRDKIVVVELRQNDEIIIVPGLKYNKYTPPNVSSPELPSDDYTHHFCETDYNFRENINKPYRVDTNGLDKAKFLITGSKGSYLQIVDIYNVLETM